MRTFTCTKCGAKTGAPDELIEAAHHDPNIHFWCSYGHELHYAKTQKELDDVYAKTQEQLKNQPPPTSEAALLQAANVLKFPVKDSK